jgi:hypothetical protein
MTAMSEKGNPTMTLYKVTAADGSSYHGGTGRWVKGRWRSVTGEIVPCENGLHLCRADHLPDWLGPVIWEAEADSEVIDAGNKVVARRARVIRRLDTWNERTARLFAADCAERVLPIYEKAHPGDDRPRMAIETARRYARGEATRGELVAARAAALAAAWDAARAAARDAALAAALATAWDAARAAALAAARAAEHKWQTARLMAYLNGEIE